MTVGKVYPVRRFAAAPVLALTALVALASGCQHVEPWQRGNLARDEMSVDPDPMGSAMRDHVHDSREGVTGGRAGEGGGCGCY